MKDIPSPWALYSECKGRNLDLAQEKIRETRISSVERGQDELQSALCVVIERTQTIYAQAQLFNS